MANPWRRLRWGMRVATLLLSVAASAATVSGQVILASIDGTVRDGTGASLPGVTITATSPALQVPQLVRVSAETGEYQITDLPAGVYRLTFELPGFTTLVREEIRLTTGFAARVDVTLELSSVAETVTVSGQSPLVDLTNTRGGTTVSNDVLQSTPNSWTMQDVYLISGVSQNLSPQNGENGTRSVVGTSRPVTYGQTSGNTAGGTSGGYQTLEGVLSYANQLADLTSMEEVQVQTFGATAEVGPQGVSSVLIVKSGGNEFHGMIRDAYQNKRFQANNIDDGLRAQGISVGREVQWYNDFSADLGGRIIPNKLWFYTAFHNQVNHTYLPGFSLNPGPDGIWSTIDDPPATDASSEPVPTGKLSFQATENHRLIGFFSQNTILEDGSQAGRFIPYESSQHYRQPFPTAKGEWRGTFTPRLVMSTLIGWHGIGAYRNPVDCCASMVSTFDQVTQQQTGSVWNSLRGSRKSTRYQVSGMVNYYPERSFAGAHQFAFGYAIMPEKFETNLPVAENGDYRLVFQNGAPAQLWTRNTPVDGIGWQHTYSTYVSDSWRPTNRLTFNVGLRWQRMTASVPAQEKPVGPWPFERIGKFPALDVGDWSLFAPRLGAALDLFGNGKTVVKGTWGRYYDDFGYGWVGQFNSNGPSETRYRWTDPTNCRCYVPGTINLDPNGSDVLSVSGSSTNIVNPDLDWNYTDEATASIERELPSNMSVRALYVFKAAKSIQSVANTLRPYSAWNVPLTRQDPGRDGRVGTPDDGDLVTFYDYDAAFRGSRFVANALVNSDRDNSWNNIELVLTRRQAGRWFAQTSFLATKNHRWIVSVPQSPNDDIFPLDETWQWSYRLSGSYELPYQIQLSTTTQINNGLKLQRTVVFSGAPSSGTISVRVEPFGATESPTRAVVNLRGSKEFTLGAGGDRQLRFDLEMFNVLNSNAPWAQTTVSGPSFGFVTDYTAPRVARIGVSFEF